MKKTNGQLSAEDIEREIRGRKVWKGGEVYKVIVHKASNAFMIYDREKGLSESYTPFLCPRNMNMQLLEAVLKQNGFDMDLSQYQIKTFIGKVI